MGFLSKLTKTPLDICQEEYARFSRLLPADYLGNLYGANDFEKAFARLKPEQLNSRLLLLEAILSDFSYRYSDRGISLVTYKVDEQSRRQRYQRLYSYLENKSAYDDDDLSAGFMACVARYRDRNSLQNSLQLFYAMKITDIIPLPLLEKTGDVLIKYGNRTIALELYLELVRLGYTAGGRYQYMLGKLIFEQYPDDEEMVDCAKDYLQKASDAGVREADALLAEVLKRQLEFVRQKKAAYEAVNEEEIARLKRLLADADARYPETKNQNLYYRICYDGFKGHAAKAEQDLIIEAVRKYNAGVDYKVENHLVTNDSISLLYHHGEVNVKMAEAGVVEFMDRAGDAYRDGYGDVAQNLPAARACYELSAEAGNQHSQLYYGIFCKEGIGGPADPAAAVRYLNEAGKGHYNMEAGRAFWNLGRMIEAGQGTAKDPEQAELVLEAAKKLGWDDDVQKRFEAVCRLAVINKARMKELKKDSGIVYPDDEDAVWLPPVM